MAPYARDLRRHVVDTLKAGGDLLLVAYDTDLVFVTLDAILRARRDDRAVVSAMEASAARLARHAAEEPFCRRLASAR